MRLFLLYRVLLGIALLVAHASRTRGVVPAALAGTLAAGLIAFDRTWDWRDDSTLFATSIRHGASPRAWSL